ncbi:hypothetical protein IFM89_029110 [Coptis chinensis]|uniref:Protein SMG7L n=1 Tax=Coptis chinensis TaxID=261450 RepID=A0A835LCW6_9MAGN|nr:hypothetical protein IFM89_029110 [Coptis chinensis]
MSEIQGTIRRLISTPTMHDDPTDSLNDGNHVQSFIVEAVNAEKQLWKLVQSKGIMHTDVQELYRKARISYEKIILNDHELAELQEIEKSLWKLHYIHIDEYRNKLRGSFVNKENVNLQAVKNVAFVQHKVDNFPEGFKSFLSEASEFYHQLVKKIKRSFGLPEELMLFDGGARSSSMDSNRIHRCQISCHRCLVCLGDLARYRELYGKPDGQNRRWSVAATHYLNASTIWPYSGSPHNQLAVLAVYVGDELLALYHCMRSLAIKEPFPDAWDNLILLFEKNRSSHLNSLSNETTFNFLKPSEGSPILIKAQPSDHCSNFPSRESNAVLVERSELWSLIVHMISYFYVKPSLVDFPCIFGSTIRELVALFSLDDTNLKIILESYQHMDQPKRGPFRALQLVSVLMFTIDTLSESPKIQKAKNIKLMQQSSLVQLAFTATFICMGRLVNRCTMAETVDYSPLLPAILVFTEWLVDLLDRAEAYAADEKCVKAIGYYFSSFVDLLNQFDDKGNEIESPDSGILWEDNELLGFLPVSQFDGPLDFQSHQEVKNAFESRNHCQLRICRIFRAAMKIVGKASQNWIFYEEMTRKFYTAESKELTGIKELNAAEADLDLKVRDPQQHIHVSSNVLPLEEYTEECEVPEIKDDAEIVDMQRNSPVEEEEEIILFKPITRSNSAPFHLPVATSCQVADEGVWDLTAPSGECLRRGFSLDLKIGSCTDPINYCSNAAGSSNRTFWPEPIPEDSAIDAFTESTDSPRRKGATWFRATDDFCSAYLTGLSIGGTGVGQQDVKSTSSLQSPASNIGHGSTYEGDSVIGHHNSSATIHHMPAPYMPPVPSAPLLPDDATWFSGNLSKYPKDGYLDGVKPLIPVASQVSCYSNLTGIQVPPNFSPNIPRFSGGYTAYPTQNNSAQWLHQYPVNHDRPQDLTLPLSYTPTLLGRFQDHSVSRVAPFNQSTNPSDVNSRRYLEDLPYHPGFYSGTDTYPGPSPYGRGAVKDLRSEQQLFLKYLKEKEWHLLQEAQLRGSA